MTRSAIAGLGASLLPLAACDSSNPVAPGSSSMDTFGGASSDPENAIPSSQLREACPGGKDCIPALTDPSTSPVSAIDFLQPSSRVVSLRFEDTWLAVPHNILWWHEIANLNGRPGPVAVTLCPLTGSSLTFERKTAGNAEFGVSGLLFKNNLVMYDRTEEESLWPQMLRRAGRGPETGKGLLMYPSVEMSWSGFKRLHPEGRVVDTDTGHSRNYGRYPYSESYDEPSNGDLLFPMPAPIDDRRPPKERVLGIPGGEAGGTAFPFGELETGGSFRAISHRQNGTDMVLFWDEEARSAMVHRPRVSDEPLTFEVRDGAIVDRPTGSEWTVEGVAVSGPHEGARLEPISRAYVAFWFAWAAFQPETAIWTS